MRIASKRLAGGAGLAPALLRRAPVLSLDWDMRQKSRFDAADSAGQPVGVVLPRGTVLRGGDVLVCEDGTLLAVQARPQPVLTVTARGERAALDLLRAAYHLGNRHVPLEVRADRLQLEPDHVLAGMLERMGLLVEEAEAAFEPEAGAYGAGAPAAHAAPAPAPVHVHGPHCHHDHDHDHDHGHGHGSR